MKTIGFLIAGAVSLAATASTAATLSYTEGKRDTVLGSTKLGDVKGVNRAFDIGDLGAGSSAYLYGRMVGAVDAYSFSSAKGTKISFAFGGFETASGIARTSGFVSLGANPNTSVFRIRNAANPSEIVAERTFTSGITSVYDNDESALIFSVGPGDYLFEINGRGQGNTGRTAALYDIEISAVPLPASSLLLLGGLGALGALRRKAKKA